jgi:hypothetical protein
MENTITLSHAHRVRIINAYCEIFQVHPDECEDFAEWIEDHHTFTFDELEEWGETELSAGQVDAIEHVIY